MEKSLFLIGLCIFDTASAQKRRILTNSKTNFFLVLAVMLGFLMSCKNDKNPEIIEDWCGTVDNNSSYRWMAFLYPKNSKLKRVYQADFNYVFVQTLEEYQYDESGRITKVIFPASGEYVDDYIYNSKGQLLNIFKYNKNDLVEITSFTYDESGKKIKEETENKVEDSATAGLSRTLFIYDNNRLSKTEYYHNNVLKYYKRYEYNGSGELIKEKLFVPEDDDSYVTTEHTYAEGLLIYSVTYDKDDKKNGFMDESKRYYDLNGNMTLRIYNMPGLSSAVAQDGKPKPFLERRVYEYFKN